MALYWNWGYSRNKANNLFRFGLLGFLLNYGFAANQTNLYGEARLCQGNHAYHSSCFQDFKRSAYFEIFIFILIYPQEREILVDSEELYGWGSHGGVGKRDCRDLISHKDSHKGNDRHSWRCKGIIHLDNGLSRFHLASSKLVDWSCSMAITFVFLRWRILT